MPQGSVLGPLLYNAVDNGSFLSLFAVEGRQHIHSNLLYSRIRV